MVTWNAVNDRRLLLAAIKQLRGPIDYERIAAEFGPGVTLNTLRIRMCTLKKGTEPSSPGEKVKSGRISKDFKATKAGVAEAGRGFAKIASEVKLEEVDTVILKKEE